MKNNPCMPTIVQFLDRSEGMQIQIKGLIPMQLNTSTSYWPHLHKKERAIKLTDAFNWRELTGSLIPHPTTAQVWLDRSTGHISPYLRLVPGSSLSVRNPAVISSISVSVIYLWPTTHNCIQVCYLFGITYADLLFRRVDAPLPSPDLLVVLTTAKVIKEPPGHWVIAFKAPALVWTKGEPSRSKDVDRYWAGVKELRVKL